MGLWVERAESFKAMGLKLGVYSTLSGEVGGIKGQWVKEGGFRCRSEGFKYEILGERREKNMKEKEKEKRNGKVKVESCNWQRCVGGGWVGGCTAVVVFTYSEDP